MIRNIIALIVGIIVSFLLIAYIPAILCEIGLTPIGTELQSDKQFKSIDEKIESLGVNNMYKRAEQFMKFFIFVFFPVISILTAVTTSIVARKKIWLIGLLSVVPLTLFYLLISRVFIFPYALFAIIYLGLGALVGFGIGVLKRKKREIKSK
jgi:hypothetical protein